MAASTPSLQELSSSVISSNLGKLAGSVECLFSCGGTIPQVENVVLFYMKKCGDWSSEPLKGTVSRYIDKNRTGACGLGRNRRLLQHTSAH